ncbi:hypothetical protein BAUCODRAFT_366419 [Baudoinia panamericana UAMH 10762]|uniref:Uncharacterized protein n=1 Tax=Baudoinia panamericana (strain UAMH 10762) TaxID=717646 RepID=M2N7R8_BAUPA|nr:uncharacterized protein BAUCODRAFT_366419 [Baudoinia panamericana UAMH 10762]EMD00154.1 hypothetical protein BAUCODRAFT_366419 [Baudoinia panamericana UAMH 10762]
MVSQLIRCGDSKWISEDLAKLVGEKVRLHRTMDCGHFLSLGRRSCCPTMAGTLPQAAQRRNGTAFSGFIRHSGFMDLPAELRREIHNLCNEQVETAVFLRGVYGRPRTEVSLPGVAFVSKILYVETITAYIEGTTFQIHSGPANHQFQGWLEEKDLSFISLR